MKFFVDLIKAMIFLFLLGLGGLVFLIIAPSYWIIFWLVIYVVLLGIAIIKWKREWFYAIGFLLGLYTLICRSNLFRDIYYTATVRNCKCLGMKVDSGLKWADSFKCIGKLVCK